jgi:hypothetical protein
VRKIIELDEYFPTGEATIQPILLWGNGRRIDTSRVSKYASEAVDYIRSVMPEPGKTILLLNAMGAEETYGPNRNGDGFPEFPVPARGKVASTDRRWYVEPGQELTKHYQSFETNPAHAFKHHVNRDPAKASGVVKKAFWNPRMHRVELLVSVDDDKDPEWVKRASDGEFVPVSMGCRIKYDVCARCGNQAPTRADYCDHAKFAMNMVDENGFKDYVHNPSPDFFDISRVFRPADRIGYTLKKVAEAAAEIRLSAALGEEADALAAKAAAAQKLSDIDKVIRAEPVASSTLTPDERSFIVKFRDHASAKLAAAPRIVVSSLLAYPLGESLSAAAANGVVLNDREFMWLATSKLAGRSTALSHSDFQFQKFAAAGRWALAAFAERPDLLDELLDSGVLESRKIAQELLDGFACAREKRAYVGEMLYRRLVPEGVGLRQDAAPTTDVLHVGPYETTRGAAIDAQDAITRAHMKKILGGGALLLGGYKALTAFPWMRKFNVPLAMGAGALGAEALGPRYGHNVRTDEGYAVPNITEMTRTAASRESLVHLVECASASSAYADFSTVKLSSDTPATDVAEMLGNVILGTVTRTGA